MCRRHFIAYIPFSLNVICTDKYIRGTPLKSSWCSDETEAVAETEAEIETETGAEAEADIRTKRFRIWKFPQNYICPLITYDAD